MKHKLWLSGLMTVLLLSTTPGYSQRRGQRPAVRRAPYMDRVVALEESQYVTKVVLKSGLTILVNEYRAHPAASIAAFVKAGYRDEPGDLQGIATLVSRMLFKATPTRAAGVIGQDLHALGGTLSAASDYDSTIFDIVVPSASWKKALEVQADALLNPVFQADELKRERDLILMEFRAAAGRPDSASGSKLLELAFAQRKFRAQPLLSADGVLAVTPEKLMEFYRSRYQPSRMVLVVAGDVIATDVLNEATRLFENFKGGAGPAGSSDQPRTGFQYGQVKAAVPQPRVLFGFHAPSSRSADFADVEVLGAILASGESSALRGHLVGRKKSALSADAAFAAYPDLGYLSLQLDVEAGKIDRCEIEALTEIELLKRQAPDDADMARAMAQLESRYWIGLQTVTGRAHALARFEAQGSWRGMNNYLAQIRQVKAPDVSRAAAKYLRLENCSLLEVLPAAAEPRNFTAETALRTLSELIGLSTDQEAAEREKITKAAVDIPVGTYAFKFSELQYPLQTASVLRGPDLTIREDHTAPVIQLGFFFPGGKLAESRENQGIGELTIRSMLQGSAKRSAWETYRQLDIYGVEISPVVTDDFSGFLLSTLSRSIERVLEIVGEMVNAPKLDKEDIARQKQLQTVRIAQRNSVDSADIRLLAGQAIFKDFPYAFSPDGSEATLGALDEGAVQEWYASHFKNRKPLVVIIGDTQGTTLAGYFVSRFSGSRFQDSKLPQVAPKAIEQKSVVEKSWGKAESVVGLGFQAPPEGDDDQAAMDIVQSYLSGMGGKLTESVRNRLAAAYAVEVDYRPRVRGGSVLACAWTDPANEERALQAIQEEIARLGEGIVYRDFRAAVNTAVAGYWIARQSPVSQIFGVTRSILAGKGIFGYQEYPDRLQRVAQEDLKDVLDRIFKLDRSVILRLHGQADK